MGRCGCRLDGRIERPKVELFLERPNEALGIRDMRLFLDPTAQGFDYRANGQSRLGPFTSNGQILLPKGGRATIAIAALDVAGSTATRVAARRSGRLHRTAAARRRRARTGRSTSRRPTATSGSRRTLPPTISAWRGRRRSAFARAGSTERSSLPKGGRRSTGWSPRAALSTSGISLARLTANARLVNGSGEVRAALAGTRGTAFQLVTVANVTPDRISITGRGELDRRPLTLDSPAVLTRVEGGWQIAPTRVRFGGGRGTLSGRTGDRPEFRADIRPCRCSCSTSSGPRPGWAGSPAGGSSIAGQASRRAARTCASAACRRAGLVLTSKPIDVGVNAVLSGGRAAMRAVAVSDGKTIGRAQARFAPLGSGPIVAELVNAPMLLQMRYAGPADTLWRLSGVEVFDLSGPVAIGADISGRLVDPQIRGSLKANGARIESAVTGMVVEKINASGRFSGPRLVLSGISGIDAGRRFGQRQRRRSISRADEPGWTSSSRRAGRGCSTATTSPRRSPVRSRSDRAGRAGRSAAI